MRLPTGLNVYWNTPTTAQLGIDERAGALLTHFTADEVKLVENLSMPLTEVEYLEYARQLHIPAHRAQHIAAMLSTSGFLMDDAQFATEIDAYWRTHHSIPARRINAHVHIVQLDHLSTEIALVLAEAGIGTITTADSRTVTQHDHPALAQRVLGTPHASALATALRERQPLICLSPKRKPDLIVVTSTHEIDPFTSAPYIAQGYPVIHGWVGEIDVTLGPFTVPHETPCAQCLYLTHIDQNPSWSLLVPQALNARPFSPESATLHLAAGFAAREILREIDGAPSTLRGNIAVTTPSMPLPVLSAVTFHPRCGCDAEILAYERITASTSKP